MGFKPVYAQAMHDLAPKMWNRICRSPQLQAHLQEKSRQAHDLFRYLTNNQPISEMGPSDLQNAERLMFETCRAMKPPPPSSHDPSHKNMADRGGIQRTGMDGESGRNPRST